MNKNKEACTYKGKAFHLCRTLTPEEENFLLNNLTLRERLELAAFGNIKIKPENKTNSEIFLVEVYGKIYFSYPQGFNQELRIWK